MVHTITWQVYFLFFVFSVPVHFSQEFSVPSSQMVLMSGYDLCAAVTIPSQQQVTGAVTITPTSPWMAGIWTIKQLLTFLLQVCRYLNAQACHHTVKTSLPWHDSAGAPPMHPVFSARCFVFCSPFFTRMRIGAVRALKVLSVQDKWLNTCKTRCWSTATLTRDYNCKPHISTAALTLAVSSSDTAPVEVETPQP